MSDKSEATFGKKEKQKAYREKNKEKLKESSKLYWDTKKEEIKTRRKQIIVCEICKAEVTRESLYRHKKSIYCQELKNKEEIKSPENI